MELYRIVSRLESDLVQGIRVVPCILDVIWMNSTHTRHSDGRSGSRRPMARFSTRCRKLPG